MITNMINKLSKIFLISTFTISTGYFSKAFAGGGEPFFSNSFELYLPGFYMWSLGIGAALAVAVIMWGGFDYATSGGDVEKINQAKEKITGAILGLLILILAALILRALGASG